MGISRRMLFGRSAVAAAAATLAGPAALAAHGLPAAGIAPFLDGNGPAGTEIGGGNGPTKFFSFAKWWMECGDEAARRDAKFVRALDPDIIGFALPLQTKMRLQQERNYQRIREDRARDFAREIKRDGSFNWWM